MLHSSLCEEAEIEMELYRERSQKEQAIRNLIMTTVSLEIYKHAMDKTTSCKPEKKGCYKKKPKHTLRHLIRVLQQVMSFPEKEIKMNIMKEYHELYDEAGRDGLSYNQFRVKWANILRKVIDTMSPDVGDDKEAIKDMQMLEHHVQLPRGRAPWSDSADWTHQAVSLLSSGMWYLDRLMTEVGLNTITRDELRWRRDASGLFLCPCFKQKHAWTPENCGNLRWAITRCPVKGIKKPSASQLQDMREAMQDPKWRLIRDWYITQGYDVDP